MQQFKLTTESGNDKTGKIAVSTTCRSSCPPTCPFRGSGCYADGFPMSLHWDKLSEQQQAQFSFKAFVDKVAGLPAGKRFRHNQAGDMPGKGNRMNRAQCLSLARACKHLVAWTYTHKPLTAANEATIRDCISAGLTVNVSANNLGEADYAYSIGLPVVVVLPADFAGSETATPGGVKVKRCPATFEGSEVQCSGCGGEAEPWCVRACREFIVGFPAHGNSKRKASAIAEVTR